jgi:hypothetical protein
MGPVSGSADGWPSGFSARSAAAISAARKWMVTMGLFLVGESTRYW